MSQLHLIGLPNEVQSLVCELLPFKDILALMKTCRHLCDIGSRVLYTEDASQDSLAIGWASFHVDQALAIRVIDYSVSKKGNVNGLHRRRLATFTALHIASALKRSLVVRRLLHHGAYVRAGATNFHTVIPNHLAQSIEARFLTARLDGTVLRSIKGQPWLPSFVPYMIGEGYEEIISILVECQAPLHLTSLISRLPATGDPPNDRYHKRCSFTMLHAALVKRDHAAFQELLTRSEKVINMQIPGVLLTPLHVATKIGNEDMLEMLLQAGADTGRFDAFGSAPLHSVVIDATRQDSSTRAGTSRIAALLMIRGANPNLRRGSQQAETPLTLLASRCQEDWIYAQSHIKRIFITLVEHGGDLNATNVGGFTLLFLILRAIQAPRNRSSRSLESFFDLAVEKGADVTIPFTIPRVSIMAEALRSPASAAFKKRLWREHGARLLDADLDIILPQWAASKTWSSEYDVLQHAHVVRPNTSDKAIDTAFQNRCSERFEALENQFVYTGNREIALARAVWDYGRTKKKLLPITFTFNPTWTHNRFGFLHFLVGGMLRNDYPETAGIADAKQLIAARVPVKMLSSSGQTPLQQLNQSGCTLPRMERFLARMEKKAEEE